MPALDLRLARVAFAGMLAWLALLFVPLAADPGPAEEAAHLVLLAPLVLVPLFLAASVPHSFGPAPRLLTAASWAMLPASVMAAGGLVVPVGASAGALVVPWAVATALLALWALSGAWGRWRTSGLPASEAVLALGWATLPGGAVWLLLARSGVETGYSDLIEILTAAHFHYAGAFAAVWAGLLGRVVAPSLRTLHAALAITLVVGFWGVAVGIALSRGPAGGSGVETAGVLALTLAAAGLGLMGLWEARRIDGRAAGLMVAASGGSLVLAMAMAAWFHVGGRWGGGPDVAWMVERHGWLVAFGFGLWGALGWRKVRPRPRAD